MQADWGPDVVERGCSLGGAPQGAPCSSLLESKVRDSSRATWVSPSEHWRRGEKEERRGVAQTVVSGWLGVGGAHALRARVRDPASLFSPCQTALRWSESTLRTRSPLSVLRHPSGSRHWPPPLCAVLSSMQPLGLEGTPAIRRRPQLRLLLLVLLLPPRPITSAQNTPGTSSSPTPPATPSSSATPAASSAPSLRERARALMRDFPLVDGCVGAGVRAGGN